MKNTNNNSFFELKITGGHLSKGDLSIRKSKSIRLNDKYKEPMTGRLIEEGKRQKKRKQEEYKKTN